MGYTNKDKRIVTVTPKDKRAVRVWRRRAEKRELRGEHPRRFATRATKRGWYYS